jgi:hypothetical protein
MQMTLRELKGNPLLEAWLKLADLKAEWGHDRFRRTTWKDIADAMRALDVGGEYLDEIASLQKSMLDRPWPASMGDGSSIATHTVRRAGCSTYAWAIPSEEALDLIAQHGPIVEIGAGTGYWARLLAGRGVDIICYDMYPPIVDELNGWHDKAGLFYPVNGGGPEIAAEHPDRTLLLCWPPYSPTKTIRIVEPDEEEGWEKKTAEMAPGIEHTLWYKPNADSHLGSEALKAYEDAGGQKLIYIGEGSGGCTAGPAFHARIGQGCDHWGDDVCFCPPPAWVEIDDIAIPQWDGIHDHMWILRRTDGDRL